MSELIDTNKVIEALTKENVLWRQKVDDLMNKVIRLEQAIVEITRHVFHPPTEIIIKK